MRILEVNKFYYARRGAERHFLDLIALLEKYGHTVAVFSMRHAENLATSWEKYFVSSVGYHGDDATFFRRMIGILRLFWSCEARRKFKSLLQDFKPDVVHVHNAYHQLSLSFFPLVRRAGIPLILTVHDYALISPDKDAYYPEVGRQYWKFLRVKKYGFGKRLLLVLKKYWEDFCGFYDFVDRFIVPSHFVERTLLSAGIGKDRIVVIPHFISDRKVAPADISDIDMPDRYLLYFGALSPEKGIGTLLNLSRDLNIPVLLAGRMEQNTDFREFSLVQYIGVRTQAELQTLIRKSIGVVSASTLPETFGLTALETIALGKPYFALDRGALSEIISNGENGFLAKDETDFIAHVRKFLAGEISLSTDEMIRKMAQENFGEEAYMKQFNHLVKSIASTK